MFYNDPYFLLLIPAFILAIFAQIRVRATYDKFSKVQSKYGYSGAEAARKILDQQGLGAVPVEEVSGVLSDHYDPIRKILRLSTGVYRGRSLASVGIAAHEAGHAVQHAKMYIPVKLRALVFPVANLGSWAAVPLFFMGLLFSFPSLMDIGIIVFAAVVAFQVVTLPVEFNASARAVKLLISGQIIETDEQFAVKSVLNAAALTYLAATAMAILQLLRLIALRGDRR
jgi:Zn-dependent membrane protease YugP